MFLGHFEKGFISGIWNNWNMPRPGFEPGTTASSGQRSPVLSYLGKVGIFSFL
jgi:hypothetical protein